MTRKALSSLHQIAHATQAVGQFEIGDIVKLVEDAEVKPGKRGPYKGRSAA